MSARITIADALRRLDRLGEAVSLAVRDEAQAAAERMAADLQRDYPSVTGNLRRGVKVQQGAGGSYVLSRAPHAHFFFFVTGFS